MKLTTEVLTLLRGALAAKLECWKNLSSAAGAAGVGFEEDMLDDIAIDMIAIGMNHENELTNMGLEDYVGVWKASELEEANRE